MKLRVARPSDAENLLMIYGQYIDTSITFEYTLPTVENFTARIENTLKTYPYLVLEDETGLLGYAYAHTFRERAAYDWGAELSVYLRKDACGKKLGQRLYRALIALLQAQGLTMVYACVTSPNPQSERMHENMGFTRCGLHTNSGYKDGQWHDICWYEMPIGDFLPSPQPIIPFSQMDEKTVQDILSRF